MKKQGTSAYKGGSGTMIIFRNLGTDLPPECMAGWNWQVELHDERGFPVGLAWVLALPPGLTTAPPGYIATPSLKFIIVIDDMRRRGVGTCLIEACLERWPDLDLGLAISEAGEALLDKFCSAARIPHDDGDGIPDQMAAESRDNPKRTVAERGSSLPAQGNARPGGEQPAERARTPEAKKARACATRRRHRK